MPSALIQEKNLGISEYKIIKKYVWHANDDKKVLTWVRLIPLKA